MQKPVKGNFALVAIGDAPGDLLEWLVEELQSRLAYQVKIGSRLPLPNTSFNPSRGQYQGSTILALLRQQDYPEAERVAGLVTADCYAQGLNFIFGRKAFVALPRLKPAFYGESQDKNLFRERVRNEVVHELGHTWGLEHCPNPECVMHFPTH